jgi:hypothetical protein
MLDVGFRRVRGAKKACLLLAEGWIREAGPRIGSSKRPHHHRKASSGREKRWDAHDAVAINELSLPGQE